MSRGLEKVCDDRSVSMEDIRMPDRTSNTDQRRGSTARRHDAAELPSVRSSDRSFAALTDPSRRTAFERLRDELAPSVKSLAAFR